MARTRAHPLAEPRHREIELDQMGDASHAGLAEIEDEDDWSLAMLRAIFQVFPLESFNSNGGAGRPSSG